MASKKTTSTATAQNEVTKPEFMTGEQYCEAYDDSQAGDFIIRIPDSGNSVYRAPKANNSGKGTPLTKPQFRIVDFGGFRAVEVPGDLTFDNGRHAGQTTYIGLTMYTLPALSQVPVEETQNALAEVLASCDSMTDAEANKLRAACESTLANLARIVETKAQAEQANAQPDATKTAPKPQAVKAA